MKAKLADAEASQQKSASQELDAPTKQIRLLQSQANSLAMQVKAANDKACLSEQKLIDYKYQFPRAKLLSGAFKKLFKLWNHRCRAYEALSVM